MKKFILSVLCILPFTYGVWGQNNSSHEWVDLGLSVNWATCNVGASKPEQFGNYYAWGETETNKEKYVESTYKFGPWDKLTKYNTRPGYGIVDNKTRLEKTDDVAYMKLGGNWRIPTNSEWTELREKCTWVWTTLNGVKGYKVTSKKNGNSIFLPAAGDRAGTWQNDVGSKGAYWSSSLFIELAGKAWDVYFSESAIGQWDGERWAGRSIRPVFPSSSYSSSGSYQGGGVSIPNNTYNNNSNQPTYVVCPACYGTGHDQGRIQYNTNGGNRYCPTCGKTGLAHEQIYGRCGRCDGTGRVKQY